MLDGNAIAPNELETNIVADPGAHRLEVVAPRSKPWRSDVVLSASRTVVVDVRLQAELPDPEPRVTHSDRRTLGYALGGTGLVLTGIGVGLLTHARALDLKSENTAVHAGNPPDPDLKALALSEYESAVKTQRWGLVVGSVGLAAVGTGLYLLLISDSSSNGSRSTIAGFGLLPSVQGDGARLELRRPF